MPKLELDAIEATNRTGYPAPYNEAVAGRWCRRLAARAGLTELGASHVTLKPGAWSSQRHWHHGEDEFLVMLSGEAVLVEDDRRTVLRAGDCAAWGKGVPNGHHLINESDADCVFVAMSAGEQQGAVYSDIDLKVTADGRYSTKEGEAYPAPERPMTWIAAQAVVFLHADGRRVAGRIALSMPHDDGRSCTCVVALDGMGAPYEPARPIQGDTTLQALMLAADIATRILRLFIERGGRVLMEDTDDDIETSIDVPLDAIFGRLWAGAPAS